MELTLQVQATYTTHPFGVQLKQSNYTESHMHVLYADDTNLLKWSNNGLLRTVYSTYRTVIQYNSKDGPCTFG